MASVTRRNTLTTFKYALGAGCIYARLIREIIKTNDITITRYNGFLPNLSENRKRRSDKTDSISIASMA